MSQTVPNGKESAAKPPVLSYKTLKNFLETFKTQDIPSQIDRSIMPGTMSGGNQVYVLAALKFLGLISDSGIPEENFTKLAKSEGEERANVLREVITSAYSSILKDVDIERATTKIITERFKETGMSGDTIRKALVFFLHAAKDAKMKVSSHIRPNTQRGPARARPVTSRRATPRVENEIPEDLDEEPRYEAPIQSQTPYQVLIDILNPDMEEEEQQAVWTLIRYLKRQEVFEGL